MSWGVAYPLYFNELRGCMRVVLWLLVGCFVVCLLLVYGWYVVLNCIDKLIL